MSILKEFRGFISRGNVLDLAVGVVIGAAFGRIVTSLVEDIIMPPIGKLISNMDFSNLYFALDDSAKGFKTLAQAKEHGAIIAYGNFINVIINFLIIAFVIFLVVKLVNELRRKEAANPTPPAPTKEEILLTEIRDILKNK
jgi:large conductance mechanosensitive channel